jgi:hypothetical protein
MSQWQVEVGANLTYLKYWWECNPGLSKSTSFLRAAIFYYEIVLLYTYIYIYLKTFFIKMYLLLFLLLLLLFHFLSNSTLLYKFKKERLMLYAIKTKITNDYKQCKKDKKIILNT